MSKKRVLRITKGICSHSNEARVKALHEIIQHLPLQQLPLTELFDKHMAVNP